MPRGDAGRWLLYGATGYTGRLISQRAASLGYSPILAGRNPQSLAPFASTLSLDYRVFALETAAEHLRDVAVVLHCAGPFASTSAPMRKACLEVGCHYLDLTGELSVFETCHAEHDAARCAGVVLCPGVGFDVIPTDCIAACLHEALPTATSLTLAVLTQSGLSRGTKLSALQVLSDGTAVREDGRLVRAPVGYGRARMTVSHEDLELVPLPFGDIATAWYTTGIPNIRVVAPLGPLLSFAIRLFSPLLRTPLGRYVLQKLIKQQSTGPDQQARRMCGATLWGEACEKQGRRCTAELETANAYDVTVAGALAAVDRLLGYTGQGGYFTPTQLLGARCVEAFPRSSRIRITCET